MTHLTKIAVVLLLFLTFRANAQDVQLHRPSKAKKIPEIKSPSLSLPNSTMPGYGPGVKNSYPACRTLIHSSHAINYIPTLHREACPSVYLVLN
jgi:hypothetical protein